MIVKRYIQFFTKSELLLKFKYKYVDKTVSKFKIG